MGRAQRGRERDTLHDMISRDECDTQDGGNRRLGACLELGKTEQLPTVSSGRGGGGGLTLLGGGDGWLESYSLTKMSP